MSALTDFLEIVGNQRVFCCQWFADNGNRVGLNGRIVAFDDRHLVIQGERSMHLIHVDDVIEVEYSPETEIVAP